MRADRHRLPPFPPGRSPPGPKPTGSRAPPPLPHREQMLAVVGPEHAPSHVHDLSATRAAAVAAQELRAGRAGEEAEVLALGPLGHRQPRGARDLPHARLLEPAKREVEAVED